MRDWFVEVSGTLTGSGFQSNTGQAYAPRCCKCGRRIYVRNKVVVELHFTELEHHGFSVTSNDRIRHERCSE